MEIRIGVKVVLRHDGFGETGSVTGVVPSVWKTGDPHVRYWDVTLDVNRQDGGERRCQKRAIDLFVIKGEPK